MYKYFGFFIVVFFMVSCTTANEGNEKQTADNAKVVLTGDEKGKPEYLTYETFKEKVWDFEANPQQWVYEGDVPCIIDFYADWCKPCKMIAPIMNELASEYEGEIKIYKIDTQTERELAQVFQIRSIPAVLFAPMKGKPMMQTGAMAKESYVKVIEDNLLKSTIQNTEVTQ